MMWYGNVTRSSGLTKTLLQCMVLGGRQRARQKKRRVDNIWEGTGLSLAELQSSAHNQDRWSSVVTPQPSHLRLQDWWLICFFGYFFIHKIEKFSKEYIEILGLWEPYDCRRVLRIIRVNMQPLKKKKKKKELISRCFRLSIILLYTVSPIFWVSVLLLWCNTIQYFWVGKIISNTNNKIFHIMTIYNFLFRWDLIKFASTAKIFAYKKVRFVSKKVKMIGS